MNRPQAIGPGGGTRRSDPARLDRFLRQISSPDQLVPPLGTTPEGRWTMFFDPEVFQLDTRGRLTLKPSILRATAGTAEAAAAAGTELDWFGVRTQIDQDINQNPTNNPVQWNVIEDPGKGAFSMDPSVGLDVRCNRTGRIQIDYGIGYTTALARFNGKAKVRKNGTDLGPRAKEGYVRALSGHDESTLDQVFQFSVNEGDVLSLLVDRESTPSGAVNIVPSECFLDLLYLGERTN